MPILTLRKDEKIYTVFYLLIIFFLILISSQLMGQFFLMATPSIHDTLLGREKFTYLEMFFSLVSAPIIETSILVYSILISGQIFENKKLSIAFSILPICALHVINFWQLPFIVAFPFLLQAIAYVRLREKWSVLKSMTAIAGLHAAANLFTIYITNAS